MSSDVWLASVIGLVGVVLGGLVSLAVSRQQMREAREQRVHEASQELYRRSADRRLQAYSEFIRDHRAVQHYLQYYFSLDGKPELRNVNELLRSAYGSAAMVFLVLEAERTYVACREVLRILEQAQRIVTEKADSSDNNFWLEVDHTLGRVMREFQNAARAELEVNGPEWPWVEPARET